MEQNNKLLEKTKLEDYFSNFKIRYLFLWIMMSFVISIPLVLLERKNLISKSTGVILTEYVTILAPLFFVGMSFKKFDLRCNLFIGKPKEKTSKKDFILNLISELLFSIGTLVIVGYLIQSFIHLFELSPITENMEETRTSSMMGIHLFLIGCILAPITEEIIFRGLLLNKLRIKWGLNKALIISSLIFALFHFDIGILNRVIFGLIVSIMYLKTESLLPSILFHILSNSLLILPNIFIGNGQVESSPVDDLITNDILIVGLITTLLSTMWISRYLYKNWFKNMN